MLVILLYNFDKPSHRSDQYQAVGGRAGKKRSDTKRDEGEVFYKLQIFCGVNEGK